MYYLDKTTYFTINLLVTKTKQPLEGRKEFLLFSHLKCGHQILKVYALHALVEACHRKNKFATFWLQDKRVCCSSTNEVSKSMTAGYQKLTSRRHFLIFCSVIYIKAALEEGDQWKRQPWWKKNHLLAFWSLSWLTLCSRGCDRESCLQLYQKL